MTFNRTEYMREYMRKRRGPSRVNRLESLLGAIVDRVDNGASLDRHDFEINAARFEIAKALGEGEGK